MEPCNSGPTVRVHLLQGVILFAFAMVTVALSMESCSSKYVCIFYKGGFATVNSSPHLKLLLLLLFKGTAG